MGQRNDADPVTHHNRPHTVADPVAHHNRYHTPRKPDFEKNHKSAAHRCRQSKQFPLSSSSVRKAPGDCYTPIFTSSACRSFAPSDSGAVMLMTHQSAATFTRAMGCWRFDMISMTSFSRWSSPSLRVAESPAVTLHTTYSSCLETGSKRESRDGNRA